jgi:hypothetical protein
MNYTQAWLEDPTSIRGILVEVTAKDVLGTYGTVGGEVVFYLSNIGYITTDSQTSYIPCLSGALQTTETLSIDGKLSMSFGDIGLMNPNGELDSWLDSTKFIWVNRPIQIYLGDPRWGLANLAAVHDTATSGFQKIFDGVIADIDSSSRETLNIKVRDKLERLNVPLTDNKLGTYGTWGGGQTNQDSIRPLIFGEVSNITPLLVDPSKLEYMFNQGTITTVTNIQSTSAVGNIITCTSTAGFKVNNPITFAFSDTAYSTYFGSDFGGLLNVATYYIKSINSSTTFTVSSIIDGPTLTLSNATLVVTSGTTNYVTAETVDSSGTTELVIEIRDNGVPIYTNSTIYGNNNIAAPSGATINLTKGTFALTKPPVGTITASIQGIAKSINMNTGALVPGTYVNNIANLICLIVTQYGTSTTSLTAAELDLTNLSNFATNNTQAVGLPILDRTNVLIACQQLASSVGAQIFMNRLGQLQLLKLGSVTGDATVYITDVDILHHSLHISNKTEVVAATKVGYCKNYTTQTSLANSLPAAHNTMFNEDWYSTTIVDTAIQTAYKLDTTPVQIDTCLIKGTEAIAFATTLNNYFKVPRIVYSFTGTSKLLSLKLGQQVNLTHNRFGLSSGKLGQVVSLSPNWMAGTINVEVII